MTLADPARAWLARATGIAAERLDLRKLPGATSSTVWLVRGLEPSSRRFVLRVLDSRAWLEEEPDLAAHEAAALERARRAGLRAPELVAHAPDDAPFGAPVVLMSFVEGRVELRPADLEGWLGALARELAAIHRQPADDFGWRFFSWLARDDLAPPAWSERPRLWERAIELVRRPAPASPPVFLHRDFHPVNVLWAGNAISGVVDWINACRGPAGVDVAHCRSNLALMYGPQVAARFLDAYREAAPGFRHDPYWDLDSVLGWGIPKPFSYPPWREFGLPEPAAGELEARVEAHLEAVLRQG